VNKGQLFDIESVFDEHAGLRLQDLAALGPGILQFHFWDSLLT
jgi:hypothetical protein